MKESFKVTKNKEGYVVYPTSKELEKYADESFPFYFSSVYLRYYKFNLIDFLKYVKNKFNATIIFKKVFPHFKVIFRKKEDAESFCEELNEK